MLKIIKKLSKFKSILECSECTAHYETRHYDAAKSPLGHLCTDCRKPKGKLTQALLHKFYNYDAATGVLTHRLPQHGKEIGDAIGSLANTGYLAMAINNTDYLVHRIIWMYVHGYMPEQVDHIDHVKTNNALNNLREVTNTINSKNASVSKNSATRVNGVSFNKARNKYRAYVTVNRKQINLGSFDTLDEAIEARRKADNEHDFHTNHGS